MLVTPFVQPILITMTAPAPGVHVHVGSPVVVSKGAVSKQDTTLAPGSSASTLANHSVISALAMTFIVLQVAVAVVTHAAAHAAADLHASTHGFLTAVMHAVGAVALIAEHAVLLLTERQ